MKPHLLKISLKPESSFNYLRKRGSDFYNQWHFHPEIELIYINRGKGTLLIGNNIRRFAAGELYFFGSNLAHMWRCDPEYFEKSSKLKAEVTVIYFHHDFLGRNFFNLPEFKNIETLFNKADQGIEIVGQMRDRIRSLITKLEAEEGAFRIITILTILEKIAVSKEKRYINSSHQQMKISQWEADRLNNIYQYTYNNFKNKIALSDISSIANLSTKSFCRYFKEKTRKTYFDFLIEIRITHACNLITEKDMTMYEVCYESGFNNLSNFNKYFKKMMGRTPLEFKKEHQLLTRH